MEIFHRISNRTFHGRPISILGVTNPHQIALRVRLTYKDGLFTLVRKGTQGCKVRWIIHQTVHGTVTRSDAQFRDVRLKGKDARLKTTLCLLPMVRWFPPFSVAHDSWYTLDDAQAIDVETDMASPWAVYKPQWQSPPSTFMA